jgi:phage/plasmid-associated DNA primase
VLAWAVKGCVDWNDGGLGTAAVERATAKYREETDIINRFFADACVFGPDESVTKKGLFEAWESWCIDNGEEAGKQNSFTRTMGERRVVKNFEEKILHGTRYWKGISVVENSSPPPSEKKVHPPKNSWKHEGGETSGVHFSEDSENFSSEPPTQEGFWKNGSKVHLEEKSAPPAVTTPLSGQTWTVDGLEIRYMPEGE